MNASNIENLSAHIISTIKLEKALHPDITHDEIIISLSTIQAVLQGMENFYKEKKKC